MSHNCNIFNGAKPNADSSVNMGVDINAIMRFGMSVPNFANSAYDYSNGMRFAFIGASGFCRIFSSSVTSVGASTPNAPQTNSNFTQAYTIQGAGTYLLMANARFQANGAMVTLRWRDTLNNALGPKSRHRTTGGQFANKVWGIITFTDASRTVFVQVTEESGSARTDSEGANAGVSYVQILRMS